MTHEPVPGGLVRVPDAEDLWEGEKRGLLVGGCPLFVLRLDGVVRAFDDRCAHLASRVSPGPLVDGVITCPAHGWRYDARTGEGVNPKTACLRRRRVEERGDEVWIDLGEDA